MFGRLSFLVRAFWLKRINQLKIPGGRAQRKSGAKSQQGNQSFLDAFGTRFGLGFGKFRDFETRRPAVREARKKEGGESPAGPIFFSHGPHIVTTGAVLVLASGSI
jgi:hypothetical protein